MNNTYNLVKQMFRLTKDDGLYVDDPGRAEVIDAVKALDGDQVNEMSVTLHTGDAIGIGGGLNDQYKCHVWTKDQCYDLLNPSCPRDMADTVPVPMGDNEVWDYPRCTIVPLVMVLAAVQHFCETGEMDPSLTWDKDLGYKL